MESTLVILKPDAVQRGLIGPVLTRLERRGLRFAAMKLMQITPELAAHHYAIHEGKPFYRGLIEFITSGPVVVAVIEGNNAIDIVRKTIVTIGCMELRHGQQVRRHRKRWPRASLAVPYGSERPRREAAK